MATVREALEVALGYQRGGQLPQAEAIYRRVLSVDPRNADALHLLGMLAYQTGRHTIAAEYIGQAIGVNPGIAPFHNNLGNVLHALGKLEEAIASFEQALRLESANPEAHVNLANVLQDCGRHEQAVEHYRQAVRLRPDCAEAHNNLGNALLRLGRREEAIACYDQALRLKPDYVEPLVNRGSALKDSGRLEEAEASCREAIARSPELAEAHSNLAAVLIQRQRLEEAENACRRALERKPGMAEPYCNLASIWLRRRNFAQAEACAREALRRKPRHAESWNNLANALQEQEKPEEAIGCYGQALELLPDYPDAHANLGNALSAELRLEEAERHYRAALAAQPEHVDAHWNLALALLLGGRWAEGWREYEWRWRKKEFFTRSFAQPRWDGAPLAGRTILLHAEQGLGDTLQFIRFAPAVKASGARVVVECQARLVPFLENLAGVDGWVAAGAPLPHFDVQLPLLSLPGLLGATPGNVPAAEGYLAADRALVAQWREQLAGYSGLRVGIAWAGNPDNPNDRARSIPLECLAPLANIPGITLLSLQKDREGPWPRPEREHHQIADTAAILENLDLVIAADTMVAHLAGALGRPVWTLLPYAPDWRWMLAHADTPWYRSMRLFRQPQRGAWAPVAEEVARALKGFGKNAESRLGRGRYEG